MLSQVSPLLGNPEIGVAVMHRAYEHIGNILSETATASHLVAREALLIIGRTTNHLP
jgi:hypothetical protein